MAVVNVHVYISMCLMEDCLLALNLGGKEMPYGRKSKGKFGMMNDHIMMLPGEYVLLGDNRYNVTMQPRVLLEGLYESEAP